MRTSFIKALCEVAAEDPRIWLLCGDLGYSVLEIFRNHFPDRYLNVGVAEQNMTGVAAGLALSGKIVVTYSIANFPTLRCVEQIRNDVCYHRLPVKVVSVGGGFAYGTLGYSHHGLEDLAIMRTLPGMTVVAPGDPVEALLATRAVMQDSGPCYLRLGKANEPVVHQTPPDFRIGRAITVRSGRDVAVISIGGMLEPCMQAAKLLSKCGVEVQLISMPTLIPLDEEAIKKAAHEIGQIVTVEEHGLGGLASAVAEVVASVCSGTRFLPLYVKRDSEPCIGSQDYLRERHGLSATQIAQSVYDAVKGG